MPPVPLNQCFGKTSAIGRDWGRTVDILVGSGDRAGNVEEKVGISLHPLDPCRPTHHSVNCSGRRSFPRDWRMPEDGPKGRSTRLNPRSGEAVGYRRGGPGTGRGVRKGAPVWCQVQGRPTRLGIRSSRVHRVRGPEELGRLRSFGYSGPRRVRRQVGGAQVSGAPFGRRSPSRAPQTRARSGSRCDTAGQCVWKDPVAGDSGSIRHGLSSSLHRSHSSSRVLWAIK